MVSSTVHPPTTAFLNGVTAKVPPMIGGGAMGQRVRDTDWAITPLGAYETWPQSLRSALSLVLNTKGIAALYWGPEQWLLYNDAYGDALGERHPWAFGRPMPEVLTDIAPMLGPQVAAVLATGEGFAIENLPMVMHRHGRDEETVWTYSFSPVQGETGDFAGVLLLATEMTRQKAAEQAEKQVKSRLETALQVARLGTFDWDPTTGAIDVDARGREIFGLPLQGLLTQENTFGRIVPKDVERVRVAASAAMGIGQPFDRSNLGRIHDYTYDLVRPDGVRRSVISSGAIIENPDGTRRMIGAFNDVTEFRHAEAQLREQNLTLEQRVEARTAERNKVWQVSRDLLLVSDLAGIFLSVNPAWTRTLGWTEAELVGRTSEWLEHPDDQAKTRAEIIRLAAGGETLAFENRFRTRDGSYRSLSWTAVPEGNQFYCVARDVTDERRQTAALIEQSSQLKLYGDLVQASAAPICAFDTEFRLIAFNQAHSDEFFRIFGYRVRLGETFPDQLPLDQASIMRGFMARALAGEAYTVTEEFGDPALVKPYWEITYSPLRDAEGRIIGAFHFARDITARLRAEDDLHTAQDALRQAQKMEAVGQLTGGVAHDFNNLLTVIKSSSDLLKRPDLAEERRTRYIGAISDTVDRAAKLTGQLLAFARRQALKPEVFAAADSVQGLTDMMGTLTGSRIQITTELPDMPCYVNADASQFDTALINMAVNARDAMDGAGRIMIRVQAVEAIPAIRRQVAIRGQFVAVSLSDTGMGIPPEMIERIFEPFFTTKETGKGTGLGLSQVFGFAKQSGGEINVESTPGEGTTFTLYLPRVPAPAQATVAQEAQPLMDGHGLCVLVVEDNTDVGTFALQSLSDLGFTTILATDGEAALAELAKNADLFDVVFSDVLMPGMSGVELGQEIRRLYHDLPVVLTSGYSQVLAQNGTYGFELLHKPYSVEQLSQILRKVVSRQRQRRFLS